MNATRQVPRASLGENDHGATQAHRRVWVTRSLAVVELSEAAPDSSRCLPNSDSPCAELLLESRRASRVHEIRRNEPITMRPLAASWHKSSGNRFRASELHARPTWRPWLPPVHPMILLI